MYAMFAVVYKCCRGRAVTNVVRTCSPTPLLKRQLNMFKLKLKQNTKNVSSFMTKHKECVVFNEQSHRMRYLS